MIKAVRTASDGSTHWAGAACAAIDAGGILGFNHLPGRLEQGGARDDDDIETGRMAVSTEDLADEPHGPVAHNGTPEFPGGREAKPRHVPAPRQDEDRHEPATLP